MYDHTRWIICVPLFTVHAPPTKSHGRCTCTMYCYSSVCVFVIELDRGFNMRKTAALCKYYGWMFI